MLVRFIGQLDQEISWIGLDIFIDYLLFIKIWFKVHQRVNAMQISL